MDPSKLGSYEFEDLEPPERLGSTDYQDDYIASQIQQSSTRTEVPSESEPASQSTSWARRVRFNSDALKRIWTGQNGPESEEQFRSPLPENHGHAPPRTPTNRDSFPGGDHGYTDQQTERSTYPGHGITPEDEYLRSFKNGTEASTANNTVREIDQPTVEVQPNSGYLQSYSEAEELLKAHRSDFTTNISAANQGNAIHNADQEQEDAVTVNPRGGIFYQILQSYQNPVHDESQTVEKVGQKGDTPPARSGATTPTTPKRRQKWYKHSANSSEHSLGALSHLMEASSKLAAHGLKDGIPREAPALKQRPGMAPRTASGKIMSLIGLKREQDTKITAHVAGILQRQKYILKMCRALMLFGAPSHRLEEYLDTTAKVLDMECQFLFIPGCMIISFDDVLTHTTEVKMVRASQGVNLGKLQDVHLIYKEVLHDIIGLDEAVSRLDTIAKANNRWPTWICVIMYGLASTAVSTFFSARLIDMPIIFVLGSLLGILQLVIAPVSKTYNTVFEVSAAILMTFLSRAIASIRGGELFCFSALAQSSIAMILPGWLVLSSALELHSKAIVPGSIRMVYAIIYSLFLGYGITVGAALFGAISPNATTDTTCRNPLDKHWNFLFVPLYVFFTTFTIQAKWKQMPIMIAIALAGYVVNFYTSQKFAASAPIAYTFGAFVIGVLANVYSRIRHDVAAAILLPAVYVQVPGSLASSGAITVGLQTATLLTNTNSTASSTDSTQLNALAFNFAASMIQIAIGITVGLFGSALLIYPLGKRRSGLWTL